MIRLLTALHFIAFVCPLSGQAPEPQLNPPAPAVPPENAPAPPRPRTISVVGTVKSTDAMNGFEENPTATRRMVASVVKAATGHATIEDAWRSLAGPDDRVGIKVTASGGRYFSTRRGVVLAVIDGLKSAGVPERNIFIWDRDAAALKEAGFTSERMGCEVRSITQPRDWDRDTPLIAPVLGQLIWGDAQFAERINALNPAESDQLSSKSHLCRMLNRDATKWINIPALSDAPGTGVHGAFYSAVIANMDNWRRFSTAGPGGANALPELYADPRIGGKCVLHILDALAVTYAGGPAANPHFATVHSTLYASRDPVAIDAMGARLLDGWRVTANLPVLGARLAWIENAAAVGNFEESMIRVVAGK